MTTDTTLYEDRVERIDHATGEIIEEVNRKVVKKEKTPEFVMLFVGGVDKLTNANLSQAEHKTLAQILKFTIKNSNMLMINKKVKEIISKDSGLTFSTVDQKIRTLVKKQMILKEDGLYFLNPVIFGKGDFNEVKKLKHTLQIDYDFDELTSETVMKTSVLYNTDENENLKVIDAKETISDDAKKIEQTIITEPVKKLETLKELFLAPSFSEKDSAIVNATQNSQIRELAYGDIN